MAPLRLTDQPIKPRREDSEDDYISEEDEDLQSTGTGGNDTASGSDSDGSDGGSDSDQDVERQDEEEEISSQQSDEEVSDLKDISFGALAKAQATFLPAASKSRKRKLASLEDASTSNSIPTKSIDNPHPTPETQAKKPKQDRLSRTSKHAPTVSSSRNPVSRRRIILSPPPVTKSRDPRFDATITSETLNPESIVRASKAYSFLTAYQADEILALKSEIKKSQKTNPEHAAELKKKIMSMEARLRNAEKQSKEREILARHKTQEKQAIREGKKSRPYFLKKSDLKKEIERERLEGMGKKQKDKMEKRKRMREKTKEAKDMPWARRLG